MAELRRSIACSLCKERTRKRIYKTRDMTRADMFDRFEVLYDKIRRLSHLGDISSMTIDRAPA